MDLIKSGIELDEETGLFYYGARYYNPQVSVWLSVDPQITRICPPQLGLVFRPEDYVYSSAADYAGDKGLLDVTLIK